jgi:hypothetical protein
VLTLCVCPNSFAEADDGPRPVRAATNAATVYWQAFAAQPTLSEDEQKRWDAVRKSPRYEPIPADVEPLIERFSTAIKIMHRASDAKTCDWDLNYSDGPMLLLPHLSKLRELSAAALIRARSRFAANDIAGAVADIQTTFKAARHAGSSPLLISVLVGASIESSATDLLASQLPKLDRPTLNRLSKELPALPPVASVADCLNEESSDFTQWLEALSAASSSGSNSAVAGSSFVKNLGRSGILTNMEDAHGQNLMESLETVEKLHASLARLRMDYAGMARIAELNSYVARFEQAKHFDDNLAKSKSKSPALEPERVLSSLIMPATSRVIESEIKRDVRRELLRLALLVQLDGPEVLKAASKLSLDAPEYKPTESGFELRYRAAPAIDWIVLSVGQPTK